MFSQMSVYPTTPDSLYREEKRGESAFEILLLHKVDNLSEGVQPLLCMTKGLGALTQQMPDRDV
jgi:hypothetical protein